MPWVPRANGFVADGDSTFSQEIFYISMTEIESVIEPDCITDDFRRESVAFVCIHRRIISFRRVTLAIPLQVVQGFTGPGYGLRYSTRTSMIEAAASVDIHSRINAVPAKINEIIVLAVLGISGNCDFDLVPACLV